MKSKTGKLIATAAAGLFIAGTGLAVTANPAQADSHEYCKAPNSCKGKGDCGVKDKHDCGGKNACKGQGWVKLKIDKDTCAKIQGAEWSGKKEDKAS